jgi:hypothetical protein
MSGFALARITINVVGPVGSSTHLLNNAAHVIEEER